MEEKAQGFLEEDYVACVIPFAQRGDFEDQPINARMHCSYYGFCIDPNLCAFIRIIGSGTEY
jgi:hypothetical protein